MIVTTSHIMYGNGDRRSLSRTFHTLIIPTHHLSDYSFP